MNSTKSSGEEIIYQSGFGNTFESESIPNTLPKGRNNPRTIKLYTEQLSGSAFTQPRSLNFRTWLYRRQPGVIHNAQGDFTSEHFFGGADPAAGILDPNPMRWSPMKDDNVDDDDSNNRTFVTGMHLLGASGDPASKTGIAIYMYLSQQCMANSYMYNSDGDFLIVPQEGTLEIRTELGRLRVPPGEIAVIPRGIVFAIDGSGRGYVVEVYKGHFVLPELGPIGSNGLANGRDFQYPTAWIESDLSSPATLYNKVESRLWKKTITTTPFNVVAWHGNHLPFKYDLSKFCAVNSVTYDHLDPSIYTVLTCAGDEPGTALCDFVIFPPRWMSTDSNTFRPPWFHRNTMTEFMGLINGGYDAKKGFEPGGASLHSCMTPHGPDSATYDKAVADPCDAPTYFSGGLAFMFETSHMLRLSEYALEHACREKDYSLCWEDLPARFSTEQD